MQNLCIPREDKSELQSVRRNKKNSVHEVFLLLQCVTTCSFPLKRTEDLNSIVKFLTNSLQLTPSLLSVSPTSRSMKEIFNLKKNKKYISYSEILLKITKKKTQI